MGPAGKNAVMVEMKYVTLYNTNGSFNVNQSRRIQHELL